jgi:hypothetical protein
MTRRRFQVYNVGIPKTGSTSMAGVFSHYRSGHEFKFEETARVLVDHRRSVIDRARLRDFVLWRDEQGQLEMDSASFSFGYIDILVEAFSEARFILTVRDCYSWLDSLLNMILASGTRMPEWMLTYSRAVLDIPITREMIRSREAFVSCLPTLVDFCLAFWSRTNAALLAALPAERTLVLRTEEISDSIGAIAAFVGIPAGSLAPGRSHLFPSQRRFHLLLEVDATRLQIAADRHCSHLMGLYFPESSVEAFPAKDRNDHAAIASERRRDRPKHADDGSFAPYIELVQPDMPTELVSPQAMAELVELTQHLPSSVAHENFIFECNLSRPNPVTDFSLLIRTGQQGIDVMRRLPPAIAGGPVWKGVGSFMETWADPGSALFPALDNVWLEFDTSSARSFAGNGPLPPSVFHGYGSPDTMRQKGMSPERQIDITLQALRALMDRAIDSTMWHRLRSCFEFLPPGTDIFQVGTMIARDTDAVRVCVRGLAFCDVVPYLERLGWNGDQERVEELLASLDSRTDELSLALDVGAAVHPRLGFECFLEPGGRPAAECWAPFLDFLIDRGIALEPKCRAVLTYPGHLDERFDSDVWPSGLHALSTLLGPSTVSVLLRTINHVKLVLDPEQPLEAKAYLAVRHLWVDVR